MPSPATTAESPSDWSLSSNGKYWTFTRPLEQSDNDDRKYRLIKLASNDLQVLLIHDADTDKSSAALDVHVGHLSDPVSLLFMVGGEDEPYRKDNDVIETRSKSGLE